MGMAAVLASPLQVSDASRSLVDRNYNVLVGRVRDLLSDDYDVEIGEQAPSAENIDRAMTLLSDAFQVMRSPFPRAFASTTGRGDIRIYWRSGELDLHLIIPADVGEAPSLYLHDGGSESFDRDVSSAQLADRLSRFSRA